METEQLMAKYVKGEFEAEGLPGLTGTIEALVKEVHERPSHIIDIHDDWTVDVKWSLSGPWSRFVCGTWTLDAFMESIGPGRELELPDDLPGLEDIPLQPNPTGQYHATFRVPANFIQSAVDWEDRKTRREPSIPYKLVVTLTYKDPCGRPGPIAGFVEYPMLQFYYDLD